MEEVKRFAAVCAQKTVLVRSASNQDLPLEQLPSRTSLGAVGILVGMFSHLWQREKREGSRLSNDNRSGDNKRGSPPSWRRRQRMCWRWEGGERLQKQVMQRRRKEEEMVKLERLVSLLLLLSGRCETA